MRQFEMEKRTTRDAYGAAVFELAKEDPSIIAIGADTTHNIGLRDMTQAMPDRVIDVGIAEQNMMAVAAGLAATGMKVWGGSFAPFVSMRALEQFRTFIAYPHLNVKMCGGMGGLSGSWEGVTHQSTEDMAIMRTIPGTTVVYPADTASTRAIVHALDRFPGPAYLRLGKVPFRRIFDDSYVFVPGKANLLEDGSDLTLIGCGATLARCLQAKDLLAEKGISARVLDMSCIKPLDKDAVCAAADETGAIVTVEEGSVIGGLGGAVAETLVQYRPVPVKIVGVKDVFAETGEHEALMDKYGLSVADIVCAAQEVLAKKKG